MFLLSGCITAVTLAAFHLANRKSDADHHEEDHSSSSSRPHPPDGTATAGAGANWAGTERRGWGDWDPSHGGAGIGSDVDPRVDGGGGGGGPSGFYSKGDFFSGVRIRGRGAAGLSGLDNEFLSSGPREGAAGYGRARDAAGVRRSKQA